MVRTCGDDEEVLLYVGQGKIPHRPVQHARKADVMADPQGAIFRAQERLEASWVLDDGWLPHHRLELENDLIGAHVLETGTIPASQLLG